MVRALWLAILLFTAMVARADPMSDFAGSWRSVGEPVCRPTEHTLVLASRQSSLLGEFDLPLRALDTALALRDAAPGQGSPDPEACSRADDALAALDVPGALSAALPDKLIVVLVEPGREVPIRVLAHVPALASWAAEPLIQTHVLDAAALSGTNRAELLSDALQVAADVSASLRYFLDGQRTTAVALRPPPEELEPLPRVWLSGIPLRDESAQDLVDALDRNPQFDSVVQPVGGSFLETLFDEAVPAETAARSAPSKQIACIGSDGDTRWAGFVAGYWRAAADPHGLFSYGLLLPAGPLAPKPHGPFEAGDSCLDATLYPLLAEDAGEGVPAQVVLDRLDAVVWSEFGRTAGAAIADRQRLAREILAAQLGAALLDWLAENRDDRFNPYFPTGQCTGPRTGDAQAVRDLVAAVDPAPDSVVALPIRLSRGLPFGHAAPETVTELAASPQFDWIGSVAKLRETLALEALRISPEAGRAVAARFAVAEERLSPWEALRLMTGSDTLFVENANRIRGDFDSFDRQAELAHVLALQGWWMVVPSLAADQLNAGALYRQLAGLLAHQTVSNRLSYARFINLFPELGLGAFRDSLFESSDANALRVGAIDLLQSLSDLEEGKPDLVARTRDVWGRFASSSGLPERPIPQVLGAEDHAAVLVAMHRLTLVVADWRSADNSNSSAEWAQKQLEAASGALAVLHDLMWAEDKHETHNDAYRPGTEAQAIHKFLQMQIREGTFSALLKNTTEVDDSEGLSEMWAQYQAIWVAARPWLALQLSDGEDPVETEAWLVDAEIATELVLTLFDTDRERSRVVAEKLLARLAEDRPWPPALRRLAARLALLAIDEDPSPEALGAILAEFDALVPIRTRQRLLDIGLFLPALVGLPVRLLLDMQRTGSHDAIADETILGGFEAELGRYDFNTFAEAPGNRALMDTLAALAIDPDFVRKQIAGSQLAPGFDRLIQELRTDPLVEAGPEARALWALMAADAALDSAVNPATEDPKANLADARDRFDQVATLCPNLEASLGPIRLNIDRMLGAPPDHEDGMAALRALVQTEVDAGIGLMYVNRLLIIGAFGALTTYVPAEVAVTANSGLSVYGTAQNLRELTWGVLHLESQIGLVLDAHPTARAFALALSLAEGAAETGTVKELDETLPLLETLLVGADAGPAFGLLARENATPYRTRIFAGTGAMVNYSDISPLEALDFHKRKEVLERRLLPATSLSERPGERLLRLAALAEARGLRALALRTAGLGVAVLHEGAEEKFPPIAEDGKAMIWQPEDPRAVLPVGFTTAQSVAALQTSVPINLVDWALCGGRGTPKGARFGELVCAMGQRLAGKDVDAPISPSVPPGPGTFSGVIAEAPCESLARAVLFGVPDAIPPNAGNCHHGPLAYDVEALIVIASVDPDVTTILANAYIRGIAPMVFHRAPKLLLDAVSKSIRAAAPGDVASEFERASVLAGLIGAIDLSDQFGYLSLLSEIANGSGAESDERVNRRANFYTGVPASAEARGMLERLAAPGAVPGADDRTLAAQLLSDLWR